MRKAELGGAVEESLTAGHVERLLERHKIKIESIVACSEQRIIATMLQAFRENSIAMSTVSVPRISPKAKASPSPQNQYLSPAASSSALESQNPPPQESLIILEEPGKAPKSPAEHGSENDQFGSESGQSIVSPPESEKALPPNAPRLVKKMTENLSFKSSRSTSSASLQRNQTVEQMLGHIRVVQTQIQRKQGNHMTKMSMLMKGFSDLGHSSIRIIVSHRRFNYLVSLLILCNTVIIGIQTEWQAMHAGEEEPHFFELAEFCFTFIFTMELVLRLMVHKSEFFLGKLWRWNTFDLLIVAASVVETLLKLTLMRNEGMSLMAFRALRVLRLVRTIRAIRVMHSFRELRLVVHGIMSSIGSMVWLIVVLCFFMFIVAVYITQSVSDFLAKDRQQVDEETLTLLETRWSNMLSTHYSLYKSISGGEDWGRLAESLLVIAPSAGILFVAFVSFAVFAVLNVVTGIFVDNAQKASESDADFSIMEETSERQKLIEEVRKVFEVADKDDDKELTFEEFERHMKNPSVQAYFRMLHLDFNTIGSRKLYNLLDIDQTGTIDINEFVVGCTKLRGTAKSIDLASVQHDIKKQASQIVDMQECVAEIWTLLAKFTAQEEQEVSYLVLPERNVAIPVGKDALNTGASLADNQSAGSACGKRPLHSEAGGGAHGASSVPFSIAENNGEEVLLEELTMAEAENEEQALPTSLPPTMRTPGGLHSAGKV